MDYSAIKIWILVIEQKIAHHIRVGIFMISISNSFVL